MKRKLSVLLLVFVLGSGLAAEPDYKREARMADEIQRTLQNKLSCQFIDVLFTFRSRHIHSVNHKLIHRVWTTTHLMLHNL